MITERHKVETNILPHNLLTAALDYARKNFQVFPLHSVDDHGECTCGSQDCEKPGKHPRIRYGFKRATSEESHLIRWWTKWPDANIGIRTGNGLFVIDVDEDEGEDSLRELLDKCGTLPESWECLTGRGRHIYLLSPTDRYIKSSTSKIGNKLDVRCEGGYVVAPPSRHFLGNNYEWECSSHPEDIPMAEAPEWLIQLACTRKRPKPNQDGRWGSSFKPILRVGERNDTLFREACHLRDLGLDRERSEHYIRLRNRCDCLLPLTDREVDKLLRSAFSYPKRRCSKSGLSKGSKRVFRYLLEQSLHKGYCLLSKEEIALVVGLSGRQVFTCIRQLERAGMVRVQEHNGGESLYFPQTHEVPMKSLHLGAGGSTYLESFIEETPLRVVK